MKKVLITDATGATGGNAIKKLLELKVPVRALVHKVDERSEKLSSQGVEIVRGDLSDFEAVSEALQGITAAYFVFPVKVPGILEATAFFAQAALEKGVGAIVNMSQISAEKDCEKSRRSESLDCRASFGSLRNFSHSSAAHLLCRMANVCIGKHQGEKYVPASLWRRSLCSYRGGRSGPGHCRDLE